MSYPLSSPVSAGDATLASHYNNLRSDALYLGQLPADAVALAALLERYESRLLIERLNTDQLRVPASAVEPVSLMIAGYMCQAVANVDLAADQKPSGAANSYYIFANRAASSTTFTLTVSTSITEAADQRRIGRFYWDGAKIELDSIRTELALHIQNLLYFVEPQTCEGRLTASTGLSVSAADVASSANVYFTPHSGNRVALYVPNYGWRLYTFGELTLDISAIDADKNLDIWLYDNAGTLTLACSEWSNDTLRAVNITRQDGIYVKSGAPNYRYLGTVRTSAAGEICDTKLKRFVWNYYNRVPRSFYVHDSTASWTYSTRALRPWNNSTANRAQFVIGVDEVLAELIFQACTFVASGGDHLIGIGLDSVSAQAADSVYTSSALTVTTPKTARYFGYPGIGLHYLQLLECGGNAYAATFYGSTGPDPNSSKSAAIGSIDA